MSPTRVTEANIWGVYQVHDSQQKNNTFQHVASREAFVLSKTWTSLLRKDQMVCTRGPTASSVINTSKKGAEVCNRHGPLLICKSERVKESQLERKMGQRAKLWGKSLKNEGLKSDCWRSSGAPYSQGTGLSQDHYKKMDVSKQHIFCDHSCESLVKGEEREWGVAALFHGERDTEEQAQSTRLNTDKHATITVALATRRSWTVHAQSFL